MRSAGKRKSRKARKIFVTQDMTKGNSFKVLLLFTLPLFLSVAFQQMYNIADSVIVGKFAANGEDALAAVGASYPITMIYMAIAVGLNNGCSVVVSQLFGAKNIGKMKCAVYTTLITSAVTSVLLTVLGAFLCRPMLTMISTPQNVYADAAKYLDIYIYGMTFLMIYNVCNGVFTALGDSKTPLYFLIFSSVGNVVLDYIFVCYLHLDVAGVAWATFAAQGIAAVLALFTLLKRVKKIESEAFSVFSWDMLSMIARLAVPAIIQQSCVSVGNMFVQNVVNAYGSAAIAGYSAAIKINTFAITCFTTMSGGISAFTAQNIGAKKHERIKEGFRAALLITVGIALLFTALYVAAAPALISAFVKNISPDALAAGSLFLRIVAPFYFAVSIKLVCDGITRGAAAILYYTVSTFADLVLRAVLANAFGFWLFGISDITLVWWSWPIGWIISAGLAAYFYFSGVWKKHNALETAV